MIPLISSLLFLLNFELKKKQNSSLLNFYQFVQALVKVKLKEPINPIDSQTYTQYLIGSLAFLAFINPHHQKLEL